MECPKCNTVNTQDSQFCKKCATSLTGDASAQASFTKTLETPSKGIIPGTTFASRYKVIKELGRGGMGVVYQAEDAKLKRTVAIKILPPELTGDEEAKARFIREAQSAAVLDHPNICTIFEVDESEGKTFISMAYVDGQNLRERIKAGPLEINNGLDLGLQTAEGLAAAHNKGIVHRDIKSANIMVTKQGQAKIMDFGLAKFAGASMLTREGVTMGTVAYMSPEQAQGKPVDHRSDIWSLGVVLYEMFGGRLPFQGETEASFLYSIVHEEPAPLNKVNPDIPIEIQKVISRALKKKPNNRYQAADELISELRQFQSQLQVEEAGALTFKSLLRRLRRPKVAVPISIGLVAIAALTAWTFHRRARIRWAREVALPEIEQLCNENDFTPAYLLALEAKKYIYDAPEFADIWESVTGKITIETDPLGADVYIRDYANEEQEWTLLGKTPFIETVTSRGYKHFKISKPGFYDFDGCLYLRPFPIEVKVRLDKEGTIPEEMVHINAASYKVNNAYTLDAEYAYTPTMAGLTHLKRIVLGEYLIDRHEVSNKQYKKFVEAGGYSNKTYWKHKFINDGQVLTWEEVMQVFVDKTGRPGPATWELGDYPDDQGEFPVCGISWYEAAAFAEYVGKCLPTVYHWNFAYGITDSLVGGYSENAYVIPQSNFGGSGPIPNSQSQGYSAHGVYDLAGNVKEWSLNAQGDHHYILGGAWDEPQYMILRAESFPPLFRRNNFGFRCMQTLSENDIYQAAAAPVEMVQPPDYSQYEPCTDGEFQLLKSFYDYPPTELDAVVVSRQERAQEIVTEEVSFSAAYGGERMIAYLFLPKNGKPPFQVMIYYPGGAANYLRSIYEYNIEDQVDWIVKSNRAVVVPVYKGTFQRPYEPVEKTSYAVWRERDEKGIKDLKRTIDYLETRPDLDTDKIGFYGISTGAAFAMIVPAIDQRIKATIVSAAGLRPRYDYWSPYNFCPRVKVPVLIIAGRYDTRIPIKTRVKPLLDLFGTPEKDKHLKIYETGHAVWFNYEWKRDTLDFLDRYFGPAK